MPNLFRLYLRVLRQLGPEARLGRLLAIANLGLAAAQFAEPVLFGRIIDALARAQAAGVAPARVGGLRPLHDRLRRPRGAARRPPGAPAPARGADRVLRAHPAAAAELPRRHAFGPALEGDARRHRLPVVALARVLPRAPDRIRVAVRAPAAVRIP